MEKHNLIRPLVYIIILNWHRLKDTLECLESVYALDYPNFKVVVVDNSSIHDLPDSIIRTYPQVVLIKNDENIGYTGGNNAGMRFAMKAGADYLWLLNNDTTVEYDCLSKIIYLAESSERIGMVSPMIHYAENPDNIQFGGSYIDWFHLNPLYPNTFTAISSEYQTGKDVCLWGTALLIKRCVVERIGYLNEDFFAYWEDTEYSLRVLKCGLQNIVCSTAKVFHKHQVTGGKKKHFYYFMHRNYIFLGNHFINGALARLRFKIQFMGTVSAFIGECKQDHVDPSLNGLWHGLKHIGGPMNNNVEIPKIIKQILCLISKYHPVFIANLITFNFREIFLKITRNRRSKFSLLK